MAVCYSEGMKREERLLTQFECRAEILQLLRDGCLVVRNPEQAVLAEFLELNIVPLTRKERFADVWAICEMRLSIKLTPHKEKFIVTDHHPINGPTHLFSAPDETAASRWIRSMVVNFLSKK